MPNEGGNAGWAEFRAFTLPFIRGTAPTRLPGARLTTYQMNRPRDRDAIAS